MKPDTDPAANALGEAIATATRTEFEVTSATPVSGGCIHTALRIAGESAQGKVSYFAKVNEVDRASLFAAEAQGLQALRARGLKLACLTNKPTAFALPLLKAKGLDGYFTHVFGGDAFARKKPDPLPLIETCKALGTLPAHTLMIGDSSNDALAARAAGCPVVLVTYGYNHGEPIGQVDADGFVDSLLSI